MQRTCSPARPAPSPACSQPTAWLGLSGESRSPRRPPSSFPNEPQRNSNCQSPDSQHSLHIRKRLMSQDARSGGSRSGQEGSDMGLAILQGCTIPTPGDETPGLPGELGPLNNQTVFLLRVPVACEVSGESAELRAKDRPGGALAGRAENLGGGEKPQAERPGKRQSPRSLRDVRPGLPSALLREPLPHGHAVTHGTWAWSALWKCSWLQEGSPGLQPHAGERMRERESSEVGTSRALLEAAGHSPSSGPKDSRPCHMHNTFPSSQGPQCLLPPWH